MKKRYVILAVLAAVSLPSCGQKDPLGIPALPGSLFVDSEPQGALIFLDLESTGLFTPDTIPQVSPGEHTVSVSLEGYETNPQTLVIEIAPGAVSSAFFTLSQAVSSRTVLVEEFTNTSCIPCAEASPIIDAIVASMGREKVVAVKYHAWFPGPTDPFYLAETEDNRARAEYYYVTGIPHLRIDGTTVSPSLDSPRIVSDIETRLEQSPPLSLTAGYEIAGNQYTVTARVAALEEPVYSDHVIHFAVVESGIHIDPPPGTNGETDFEHVMRRMLPSASGESFNISQGDTLTFQRQFALDASWNANNIETVVFVQSRGTLEILQACSDHE